MHYRVQELAEIAGVSVDTIRFYQTRGLLDPPQRTGRTALYGDNHVVSLGRIRRLAEEGLTLKVIKRLIDEGDDSVDGRLMDAMSGSTGEPVSRECLAEQTGVPPALLAAAESAGLLQPVAGPDGSPSYTEQDVDLVKAGLAVLGFGLPLDDLLTLAQDHARNVESVAERAVELFNLHVRRNEQVNSPEEVVLAFEGLLPAVTTLVAQHFRRTLVAMAKARIDDHGGGL